ncbi:MAG: plasmid stabilization protein [Spirochaetae bacterium HGW-Spirochaetae-1]|jgi:addiction module RelE/StbE family toxin|nr:MAG: plasmid stabilization protein [Spirochaetae bacterium HGW-Spirochaetae-1]
MGSRKFTVYWTHSAQNDLIDIIEYLSLDSNDTAKQKYTLIKNNAIKLGKYPERGRIVPELILYSIENYRELIISPWRMIYKIEGPTVYIIALFDGRRNFEDILLRRIIKE